MTREPTPLERRASELARQIGQALRGRREQMRMTQADFAVATGVSRHFIIDVENGNPRGQLGLVMLLAQAARVDLNAVLGTSRPTVIAEGPDIPDSEEAPDEPTAPRLL
jgi:transcriptional regulator with XRE-family HTH domain